MALDIKQYFFDSIEPSGEDPGDERIYPADEFVAGALRCLVTDGIYNGGSNCQIMETELAYTVAMLPGMAWIDGYYMNAAAKYGDSDERHLIQLAAPTGTVRCDRIVIRLNRDFTLEGRYIKPMVITGAEGSLAPPDMTRDAEIYDISLATVVVRQTVSVIPQADITDTRMDGTVCGVADFRPNPDLSTLIQQLYTLWTTEYAQALETAMEGFSDIHDIPGADEALAEAGTKPQVYTLTLPASSWAADSTSGMYTQAVTIAGATAGMQVDLAADLVTLENIPSPIVIYNNSGALAAWTAEPPVVDVSVQATVVETEAGA